MNAKDLIQADSRGLFEPMAIMLEEQGPKQTLEWLIHLLEQQRPALRSSNSVLVAYTGCPEAIDWLESRVASPVTTHWGEGAALLGTPWNRIQKWLESDRNHQMMALDALYAFRLSAPNMAPLAQIAAPVLVDSPSPQAFETALHHAVKTGGNPRIRQTVDRIMVHASEILAPRERGVSVSDLPKLFRDSEPFQHASGILGHHEKIVTGIREFIDRIKPR